MNLFRLLGLSRAIILYVDPTGYERGRVLETCAARHFHVVEVFSPPFASRFSREVEGVLAAPAAGEECTWAEALTGRRGRIVAVCCGSDDGLATAERLAAALTPHCSNGINVARRDKYLMHEALRAAGLRAAQQRVVSRWEEEGEPFVRELLAAPSERGVVCKPRRGQASIRVSLADSVATAGRQCRALLAAPVALLRGDDEAGSPSVLLQEELRGREWVVDSVSRDGEHKVVALWRYSKASLNGAPFVNLCDELRPANDADDEALMEYARRVLDALGVRWGPAHLEIKRPPSGPVLVEANVGRWNGVDFKLLADACLGYNAYEATLDAFTDRRRWEALPATPPPALGGAGRLVKLVSSVEGELRALRHAEELAELPSLVRFETEATNQGDRVKRTVDLDTCAGLAVLLHADAAQVEADYARLRALQPTLFEVESVETGDGVA